MSKSLRSYNPKVLILGPTNERWSANGRHLETTKQNAIEAWAFTFNGDYRYLLDIDLKIASQYDIVICNSKIFGADNTKLLQKLAYIAENRLRHVKWVTSIEGPGNDYLVPDSNMKRLLDASDLVNCINKHTLPLFKKLTTAKVELIGFPYPLRNISRFALPWDFRYKKVFICPSLLSRWNDYLVAKELGIEIAGYEFRASRKLRLIYPNARKYYKHLRNHPSPLMQTIRNLFNPQKNIELARSIYNDSNLIANTNVHLNKFYTAYNNCLFWLNLDDRYTWGRYVLDAAALQMPIITTKSTGHGEDLFPYTCLDSEYEIEKAIEISRRLLTDREFFEQVVSYPAGKLDYLQSDNMKIKLLASLGFRA